MTIRQLLDLAHKHLHAMPEDKVGKDSAALCLMDAENLLSTGLIPEARQRAFTSLEYSIGILHPDYIRSKKEID